MTTLLWLHALVATGLLVRGLLPQRAVVRVRGDGPILLSCVVCALGLCVGSFALAG